MKSRELQQMLATLSGRTTGDLDQRTRPLRKMARIDTGPRGHLAPHMNNLEAALHVVCLVSTRAADAGDILAKVIELKAVPRSDWVPFEGDLNLIVALAGALSRALVPSADRDDDEPIFELCEIQADGSLAWVHYRVDGTLRPVLFTSDQKIIEWVTDNPETYDATGAHHLGHRVAISAAVVEQIALSMQEEADGAGYAERAA